MQQGWYDFAKPSLDDLLKSVREDPGTGTSAPSTKSDKPTSGEVESAKEKAVGGGQKKCQKGKSCSATCIYQGDDCLVNLSPEIGAALSKLVNHVKGYVSRGGDEKIAMQALSRFESSGTIEGQGKKIAKALNNFGNAYPNAKEREEKISQVFDLVLPGIAKKGDTGEKQALSEGQINFLIKNKAIDGYEKIYQEVKSGKLKTPEEINAALLPFARGRRVNDISDAQVDLAMSMLPKDLVSSLGKQGMPGEWGKWGANQDTLAVPEGGHTPKNASATERARLIVRIGMQEGMRDMYTGQRVGFGDIDLEHTILYGVARAGAETGSNFGLTTRKNNREKGDISPEEWRSKVLAKYPTENGVLTSAARQKLQNEQADAQKYNDDKARVSGGTTPATVASVFKGIDESSNKGPVKQKLKNKALQSMAGYGETYLQGFRANRAGASRRVYIYRGNATGEKIMDTAAMVIDKYSKEGDSAKVEKALDILRSAAPRIHEALDSQYGPKRLDNEATGAADVANKIRQNVLSELEAL